MIKPHKSIKIGLITATLSVMLGESVVATSSQLKTSSSSLESTPIILAQNSSNSEADRLRQEGLQLFQQGTAESLRQALEKWQVARQLYRAAGDRRGEAVTLLSMGRINDLLGEKQTALDYYNQALPLYRAVGDRGGEATTLSNIGAVYDSLGEKQTALDYLNQALPLFRAVEDIGGEAATLNNIGHVYDSLGEKQTALDYYNQALPLRRAVGDTGGEAATLNNIGHVYDSLGEKQTALDYYNQALPLSRAVGDRRGEAATLNNIGLVYDSLGEKQTALDCYNQALPLLRAVGDRGGEATTLNNIGGVYDSLGEKQTALDYLNQALPLRRAVGDRGGEATTLSNIGAVYDSLGEKQTALDYYNQALPLLRAVGDRGMEATTLSNIGAVYDSLGEKQTALDYYNQALPLLRAVGDRGMEATTLSNIGAVYDSLGEKQTALDYYNQALPLRRAVGDREGEATTLSNIGAVYDSLGEKQTALDYLNQALPLSRAVGDRGGEATILTGMAFLQRSQGELTEALVNMEKAINLTEELRSLAPPGELRQTFFSTVQDRYQLYIELLMELHQQNPQKGYDALAFHASERSRARRLLELLAEAGANIREGVDPQLLQQEQSLIQQLNAIEHQRYELTQGQFTTEQIDALKTQSQSLINQLNQLQTQIRVVSPNYANLQYPQPLNLEQVQQQVLDDDTLLLQYYLGEERSFLWAVTKDSITSYILPAQGEIEAVAAPYREAINRDNTTTVAQGLPLSEILISPVVNQLNNQRLLIVGDGILQFIPFAALPIPSQPDTPLLVEHEIVTASSATLIAIQREQLANRDTAAKIVAVLADPIFESNDQRLNQITSDNNSPSLDDLALARATRSLGLGDTAPQLNRLKYSRVEAENIAELVPENERMKALGFEASRYLATHPNLSEYQIIHFATHGLIDTVNPELSGLVLSLFNYQGESDNGFVRLNDIFNLNLPAELVVLSACQTGLGREVRGEGLVGLTRGFMYAGARRVVVSLWNVNDLATSQLMTRFYQEILNENQQPIIALREAQLEMWNSGQWQSPYYWGAFTIQGDWR
ncbi:CHAT domain-containing tetratricopeptide repeat protein [Limnospira platensis]|uniref:CHAT domain-containing tetratricopeptide repeat protein n=1 Tax=Limnospira platensis TaxID=118562 RepID=UPI0016830C27|nr:CHAT domain-containing protein [Arthrospira platensis FACHB-835]